MKIAGTGHRPDKLGYEYDYHGPYTDHIKMSIQAYIDQYRPSRGGSGMAIGFDMILAIMLLKNHIPLTCFIPCKGQESRWPQTSQKIYNIILSKATEVIYLSEKYTPRCMQQRNIIMTDWLDQPEDRLITAHNGSPGGTNNCIEYAKSKGKILLPIDLSHI